MKQLYRWLLTTIGIVGFSGLGWGQCFNPPATFAAGVGPISIVTADLNADGKADLAVSNYKADGTVTVLLNDGNGNFPTATSFAVGGYPLSITVGDFNGDGRPDLATANQETIQTSITAGSISVLLNNGAGGFGPAIFNRMGVPCVSLATADFNGDGKSDLVAAVHYFYQSSGSIAILLGNGTGSFGSVSYLVGDNQPTAVTVSDFNNDSKVDLAVINNVSNTVSVILGNGDGRFGASTVFNVDRFPQGVVAGDFNGDGKSDLAVSNGSANTVSVLLNNGVAGFTSAQTVDTGQAPFGLAANDLNGDGKLDLVSANAGGLTVSVLTNNGSGGFTNTLSPNVGTGPYAVAMGDFNGDGRPDIVTANTQKNTISVLLNCTVLPATTSLALVPPAYDCTTGQLALSATGGNGTLVEYRIVGLRDWATSNAFLVPTYQRTGTSFTLEARQNGVVVSFPFTTVCQTSPPTPLVPPTPPAGTGLALSLPAYDCTIGQLMLSTTGGNGQLIEYRVAGLRDWATSNAFSVPSYQRTGTSFTLEARQSGMVVSLPFTVTYQTPPPASPASQPLTVSSTVVNCLNGSIQLIAAGGDGTPIEYKVPGLRDYSSSSTFTVPTYQRSNTTFTLYARQSGYQVTSTYTTACPVGARLASTETGSRFEVVIYPNPVGEQFTVGVRGAAGQVVRYQLTNLQGQTMADHQTQVQSDVHSEMLQLPASGAGMYLLRVSTDGQSKTLKVLKP